MTTDDLIGKTLGQYEIIEEIGRGGMATVYRARQSSINRIVAVKVLPRNLMHDPDFYERFEREVDVVAHLEHPHILPIYDYGKAEDVPFIVMRYLGGGSLRDLVRRGIPAIDDLEKPLVQVAQALDHAHKEGIIHRDLKPGNVMLDVMGNAYLSDFGIARVLGSELTGSAIIGTPAYMSPEQANGLPLDARSDVYSLGVMLFEMITGREPFQAETPMALLLKHINEPMPAASLYRTDVPVAVETVIARATTKDPDNRYLSAGDMARDFQKALHAAPQAQPAIQVDFGDTPTVIPTLPKPGSASLPPQTLNTAPLTPAIPVPKPAEIKAAEAEKPNRLPIVVAAGLVIALLLLGGGLFATLNAPSAAPTPDIAATQAAYAALVALTPTPFANSQRVVQPAYSISIPQQWIPPEGFYDLTDDERLAHVWQDVNAETYVALVIPNQSEAVTADTYENTVRDYTVQYYDESERNSFLTLIDESTAPDGTLRRSYRMVNSPEPAFPPGQLDVFFLLREDALVVLEMYSADSKGNTLVPTFQKILDSVQISAG